MVKKTVKLELIPNETLRKSRFKQRKGGLKKKLNEITTLCGVEACAIIYGPYDFEPDVWPSPGGAQKVLTKFTDMPQLDQTKKMVNHDDFLLKRIVRTQEQLKKQRHENRGSEMNHLMFQCLGDGGKVPTSLGMIDLNDLRWVVDKNLKDVNRRMEKLDIMEQKEEDDDDDGAANKNKGKKKARFDLNLKVKVEDVDD